MYHASDHTMSNVLARMQTWDEKFARINKARKDKGISDLEWMSMRREANANHSQDTPFLKELANAVDRATPAGD